MSGGGHGLVAAAGLAAAGAGAGAGAAAGAGANRGCTIGDGGSERGRGGCVELCSCLAASRRLIAPGDGMSLGGFFGWLSISERNFRASRLTSKSALASRCSSARRAAAASVMKAGAFAGATVCVAAPRCCAGRWPTASLHRSAAPSASASLLRSRVRGASAPPSCQRGHNSAAERRRGCRRRLTATVPPRHRGREVRARSAWRSPSSPCSRPRRCVMEDRKLKKRKFKMVENQNHSDAKLARMKEIVRQRLERQKQEEEEKRRCARRRWRAARRRRRSPNPSRSPSRRSRRSPTCPTRRRSRRCRRSSR